MFGFIHYKGNDSGWTIEYSDEWQHNSSSRTPAQMNYTKATFFSEGAYYSGRYIIGRYIETVNRKNVIRLVDSNGEILPYSFPEFSYSPSFYGIGICNNKLCAVLGGSNNAIYELENSVFEEKYSESSSTFALGYTLFAENSLYCYAGFIGSYEIKQWNGQGFKIVAPACSDMYNNGGFAVYPYKGMIHALSSSNSANSFKHYVYDGYDWEDLGQVLVNLPTSATTYMRSQGNEMSGFMVECNGSLYDIANLNNTSYSPALIKWIQTK